MADAPQLKQGPRTFCLLSCFRGVKDINGRGWGHWVICSTGSGAIPLGIMVVACRIIWSLPVATKTSSAATPTAFPYFLKFLVVVFRLLLRSMEVLLVIFIISEGVIFVMVDRAPTKSRSVCYLLMCFWHIFNADAPSSRDTLLTKSLSCRPVEVILVSSLLADVIKSSTPVLKLYCISFPFLRNW